MNRAVIGVGSNIEPDTNIAAARRRIDREHEILAESQYSETQPVGYTDQPNFINGAILIDVSDGNARPRASHTGHGIRVLASIVARSHPPLQGARGAI